MVKSILVVLCLLQTLLGNVVLLSTRMHKARRHAIKTSDTKCIKSYGHVRILLSIQPNVYGQISLNLNQCECMYLYMVMHSYRVYQAIQQIRKVHVSLTGLDL